jgi:hypothetical protein
MKDYGALELGVQRFHPRGARRQRSWFIDLWRFKEGTSKITRFLGYGHRAKQPSEVSKPLRGGGNCH